MKSILLFCLIILTTSTIQSQTIEGTYANKWVASTGEGIEYALDLHEDGNFTFDHTRMYLNSDVNTTVQVKGTWVLENHLLVLKVDESADENDLATKLNLSKARYISISPRNPNFNLVKPSLKFYESEVFYVKDMELVKTASSVSSAN